MFSFVMLFPLLHTGAPPEGPTYAHWVLDPKSAVYIFGVTALYLAWVGPLNRRRTHAEQRPVKPTEVRWFLLGSLAALVALGPPLDDWSGYFFVSAHMLQHLILMFVTAPCWIAGVPAWVYRPILEHRVGRWIFRHVFGLIPALFLSSLVMIMWHVPALYDAALSNSFIHAIQHQFFLLAGIFMFWPLMSKVPEVPQLSPPIKCLYLFVLTIPSGIVGMFLTFAKPGLYSGYDQVGIRPWGLDIKTDQEIAGLMMAVGMNMIILGILTYIFLRWANSQEKADREAPRSMVPRPPPVPVGMSAGDQKS